MLKKYFGSGEKSEFRNSRKYRVFLHPEIPAQESGIREIFGTRVLHTRSSILLTRFLDSKLCKTGLGVTV